MHTRPLGRTGIVVSEIGFGCWGIGGLVPGASYGKTDDRMSIRALHRAFDLGITFFDTADSYGNGHSESLLGEAFGGKGDKVVIATKAGHGDFSKPQDFSPANIRASIERSLRRLKRDSVDLLQLHSPPMETLRADPAILATVRDLQREGKIRAYGISTKTPAEAVTAITEFQAPMVQVNFNIADQRALDVGLFDLAAERQVGVVARTPLAFGFLSGKLAPDTRFPDGDHRANWSRERIQEWVSAGRTFTNEIAAREGQTPAQIALRFCLSQPAVSTIIPGMLQPEEVEENAEASGRPLAAADIDTLKKLYAGSSFASVKIATPATPKQ